MNKIEKYNLPNKIQEFTIDFKQKIRLVLGEAGTGKTHGLSKCVEFHLENNSPALIIQAKGSPYNNWTKILSTALENHWNKDEILSALESLAIKNDVSNKTVLKTGEELNNQTKALIFVDGLEEEIGHENEWYERIRECKPLTEKYPRVRFIFSARSYFYKENEFLRNDAPKVLHLPREGDVSIEKVAPSYFQKYNIQLSSLELIRGIDSLLALRLFCNEYKNKTINSTENIVTATSKLINIKIDNLENDFSKNIIRIGKERYPINDSLRIIANCFFQKSEVEHNELFNKISPELNIYLNGTEIDNLIDYLADNAILIKNKREDKVLKKPITYYNITYQPLIEHI
ncbi:MAG: hypothetical protein ORN58_03240, partial [Sediminibacterium sp.]|nr:hypothetical protein [Sediminibacterium sp.]